MQCIACGKNIDKVKRLLVPSDIFIESYEIVFCDCGLGSTIIPDSNISQTANATMYNNVAERVDIYFHRLKSHIKARYIDSLSQIKRLQSSSKNQGKKLLEIGSNIGYTANIAGEQGFVVTACELNDRCRTLSEMLFDLNTEKDFFELQETYDVIVMCDVLEHFPDPVSALKKIHSLLNSNGLLFIQLPHYAGHRAKKEGAHWGFFCVPDHLFHFTPKSLEALISQHGFKQQWVRTVDIYDFHPLWRLIYPRRLRLLMQRFMNSFLSIGFKTYKNDKERGDMIQVIFRKD